MKNSTQLFLFVAITLLLLSSMAYFLNLKKIEEVPVDRSATSSASRIYTNTDFGFTFSLPENWKGYTVIATTWEGNPLTTTAIKQTGPKLLIRNPKWTAQLPYQDIPVLVFTLAQWNAYRNEDFSVSAAPILATELGRNTTYVFALPPRWNFDYSEGYKDAENIVKSNPLTTFTNKPTGTR